MRMSVQSGNLKGETDKRISFDWRVEGPPFHVLSGQSHKLKAVLRKLKVLFGQLRIHTLSYRKLKSNHLHHSHAARLAKLVMSGWAINRFEVN